MKSRVRLPRNVQFIYEHSLAREELEKGFGLENVSWNSSDPWTFLVDVNGQRDRLLNRSAYVGQIDEASSIYSQLIKPAYQGGRFNRTRSVNQYLSHWIYPYKGKFHPQMIRALINMVGAEPGWKIFEPFCGSGTAPLEAQLLGLDVLAIDISPLCVLLTQVKTQAWKFQKEIRANVQRLLEDQTPFDQVKIDSSEPIVRGFFEIARMVTLSDMANRERDPKTSYPKNLTAMLESISAMARAREEFGIKFGKVQCKKEDIRNPSVKTLAFAADLVVTSPPYSIALDYVKNDKHALEAMGFDLKTIREEFIGVAGRGVIERLQRYESDMKAALKSISAVLKPGGRAIVIVGDVTVSGEERYTTTDFITWAQDAGLHFEKELPKIVFGLYNVMEDEKILFFRRNENASCRDSAR